jgi:hypothetical protein
MPAKSSIAQTAVSLGSGEVLSSVVIYADEDNAGVVFVGYSSAVTAGSTDATDGMPIKADRSYQIPVALLPNKNLSDIKLISDAGTNKVYYDYR